MGTRRLGRIASRTSLVLGALSAIIICAASPALAGNGRNGAPGDTDDRIVLSGNILIDADERVATVVIFDGDATIDGRVDGDVVAFNGDIKIDGRVGGSVVALNGRAAIGEGARVDGDVLSSEPPRIHESATVDGEVREIDFSAVFEVIGAGLWILWWIAVTVSTGVLGVLALALVPRAVDATARTGRRRPGLSIGWGFGVAIGIPVASMVALLTVVGIPLGGLGLISGVILAALGYVLSMFLVGRLILPVSTNPYLAFLLGWIIFRVVGGVPVVGGLAALVGAVFGTGAIVVAAWNAARGSGVPGSGVGAEADPVALHPF